MKKESVIVLALLVSLALVLAACSSGDDDLAAENETTADTTENATVNATTETNATGATTNTTIVSVAEEGTLAVTINALSTGIGTSLVMELNKIEVHSAGAGLYDNWTTVHGESVDVDLENGTFSENKTIPKGSYDFVRLTIDDDLSFKVNNKDESAAIPSYILLLRKAFSVSVGETTTLTITFNNSNIKKAGANYRLRPAFTVSDGTSTGTYSFVDAGLANLINSSVEDCIDDCGGYCTDTAATCESGCFAKVAFACDAGGGTCRDNCDPYVSIFTCRDACEAESASECNGMLKTACRTSCNSTKTSCGSDCTAAC